MFIFLSSLIINILLSSLGHVERVANLHQTSCSHKTVVDKVNRTFNHLRLQRVTVLVAIDYLKAVCLAESGFVLLLACSDSVF